jgi:hypothetical protein
VCGKSWSLQVEAGEKVVYFVEVVQLPPPGLRELPAPIEPYNEEKGKLRL